MKTVQEKNMSENIIYITGAIICFGICFYFLYKNKEKYDNNEIIMLLFIAILTSLLSWPGIFFIICAKILMEKRELNEN